MSAWNSRLGCGADCLFGTEADRQERRHRPKLVPFTVRKSARAAGMSQKENEDLLRRHKEVMAHAHAVVEESRRIRASGKPLPLEKERRKGKDKPL